MVGLVVDIEDDVGSDGVSTGNFSPWTFLLCVGRYCLDNILSHFGHNTFSFILSWCVFPYPIIIRLYAVMYRGLGAKPSLITINLVFLVFVLRPTF